MTKNKFQLKREATYQLLVEAGMKCFSEKGYAATTLGDIVARTGHTKGAFYGHFTSKEQLFMHVLDYQIQLTNGWTDIPRQFNPANTTLEEVISITLTRLAQMLKGADNWIVVLIDFYQQTKHDPVVHGMLKEKYREWIAGIEALVNTLQEQGWIPPDKDTRLIAMQVISFNEGYAVFSLLFGGTDPQAHIKGLVKLMS
ncbi:TetR/AcrR family transcriptional regulator [Paenibacillus sp. WQ 127069]|uniref:TetR/AcrR family transcriptional regulator n=1 Tax=Paenibacillus baimaensis TaxID=2982185 RepID=A0ABT2UCJ2_9BACL|nr:TetR/AcrR family transcriptional regulator [Paenibacillus sp. WQ 127069]MCU6792349.1 TetR/AcrR family transcriptional regulator [Paenibacillus sp. WQ 127069]